MTRFVFLSFAFIGWAFYEVSGGQDFAPVPPERLAVLERAEAQPATAQQEGPRDETEVDISAALAAESAPLPKPIPVSIVSAPVATPDQERVALIPSPEELASVVVVEETPADIREVRGSRVNMRSGPGTQFSVLGTLRRGERVEVLREPGNGWAKLKVEDTGRIGWMASRLLQSTD